MNTFRLLKDGVEILLVPIADLHWKVVRGTELRVGDEVTPVRAVSWRNAKYRINGRRTRVSPRNLVLLNGVEEAKPDHEVQRLLRERPWEAAA